MNGLRPCLSATIVALKQDTEHSEQTLFFRNYRKNEDLTLKVLLILHSQMLFKF